MAVLASWLQVVTVLCWSLNYWQSASALSGEIEDINTAFPSAMVTSLWLSVLLVGLTVLAATGATDYSQADYRNQLFLGQIAGRQLARLSPPLPGSHYQSTAHVVRPVLCW